MESSAGTKKAPALSNKVIIIAAAVIVAAIIAVGALVVSGKDNGTTQKIAYASEATVILDQDSLQAAMDEAVQNAKDGNVGLRYKNNAYSEDGINFTCMIANSASNAYDMFLTIYADAEMTDQIFLSGLVPPGSGFESLTLDKALEPGDHTVYVALTQVKDDENGEQVIHNQVVHTMEFHVTQ